MQQGGGFQDFGSGRQKFDSQAAGQNLHAVDWNKEQLLTIKKDFYVEHPNVKAMTEDQHRAFLQSNDITVTGASPIPKPIGDFKEACFPEFQKIRKHCNLILCWIIGKFIVQHFQMFCVALPNVLSKFISS